MAGMKGEVANLTRPREEYNAAVERAIALGHGGAIQVAKETGIPVDTLRPKIQKRKKELNAQPSTLPTIPELPDNPSQAMATKAKKALWVHLCRLTDETAIEAGMKINVKEIGDTADAIKKWEGVGQTPPPPKQTSALQSLSKSGSIAA